MRIQHNIAALNSYRQLGGNNNAVAKNLEKLSSGYKINRAGDDAAGLAISEKMRAQITGLETAQKNAQDGISLVQTAEGALTEVHSMLNRMVELATQSSNGTYSDTIDRENLQAEVDSLRDEINRISESTNFNGINLLDGSLGGPKTTKTPGDVMVTSAVIGGKAQAATAATGNQFTVNADDLKGAGNGYVTISYTDEKGEARTKDVKFAMDADAKVTSQNLANAINTDKDLKNVFKASVDETTGALTIEGKQTGADAKSKITGIKAATMSPTGGAQNTGAAVQGKNTQFDAISNLATDKTLKITSADGTIDLTMEYDGTANAGNAAANKFNNLDELNAILAKKGLEAKANIASGTTSFAGTITDLEIFHKDTGFNADVSVTQVNAAGKGTVIDEKTPATAASFKFGAIDGLKEGKENTFEISYKKANNSAATVKFTVVGGKNDVETRKNIEEALQKALDADAEFKKAMGEVDVVVDETDGSITITSQEEGQNGSATIDGNITSLTGTKSSAVEGENAVFDSVTLAAGNKLRVTKEDGTVIDLEYATTGNTGANKFSNLNELNTLLAQHNLVASVKKNTDAFGSGKIEDLTILDKNTGFDAGVTVQKVVVNSTPPGTPDTVTDVNVQKPAVGAEFKFNALEGLAKGEMRDFELNFKDAKGDTKTVKFSVKGGRTDEETRANVEKALQDALNKNADFKAAIGEAQVKVDDKTGEITVTAQNQGRNGVATIDGGITVAANAAAGKDLSKTEIATGNDTHLNLKDAFDKNSKNAFKDGDTVTIGKNTYTFKKDADGSDGKTFGDLGSLITAAEQNGVHLEDTSGWDDGSSLVAKSAAEFTFDFDGRIGSDVLGASIDFAGSVFKFVEAGSNPAAEEGVTFIEIEKEADAERIAEALQKALDGVKSTKNAEKPEDGQVSWTSEATENKSGKKTVVTLTADDMGKIDLPKTKFKDFGINLQVGDTNDDYQKVRVSVDSMDAASLGIDEVNITTQNKAGDSIKMIKDAINTVSSQRGKLGAVQNRLEHTINNLGVTTENITAAESRIRDTDMAKEMMAYTKNNILVQSAQAMLAQANTLPQGVLQLLG